MQWLLATEQVLTKLVKRSLCTKWAYVLQYARIRLSDCPDLQLGLPFLELEIMTIPPLHREPTPTKNHLPASKKKKKE